MSKRSTVSVVRPAKFNSREMAQHAGEAAALLRAMASEHRLMVLCSLVQGELPVSELLEKVPLTQSALSQHLAVLRHEGLVATRRQGQAIYYQLTPGPALGIIQVLYENFCPAGAGRGGRG